MSYPSLRALLCASVDQDLDAAVLIVRALDRCNARAGSMAAHEAIARTVVEWCEYIDDLLTERRLYCRCD